MIRMYPAPCTGSCAGRVIIGGSHSHSAKKDPRSLDKVKRDRVLERKRRR